MTIGKLVGVMMVVIFGIFSLPVEDLFKVYVVTVVVLVTTFVNLIFRINKISDYIVKYVSAKVLEELYRSQKFLEIVAKKRIESEDNVGKA
jgi:hypothetical protein